MDGAACFSFQVAPLLLFLVIFCASCSHVDTLNGLENHVVASTKKADTASDHTAALLQKKLGQAADYGAMLNYGLALPLNAQNQKANIEVDHLLLNVTGPAPTPEATIESMMNDIIRDDLDARRQIYSLQLRDDQTTADLKKARAEVEAMRIERDKWQAAASALALQCATAWDKSDHLTDCVIAFIVLGLIAVAVWAFVKIGTRTVEVAGTIASKIP